MSPKLKKITFVDLFCGAGGTTTGAMKAMRLLGFDPQVLVVNHDKDSIATHKLNHPDAVHLCTGVDDIEPRSLYKRGELDALWASPECTNHSKAKGGKPRDDQSRATAHCILKWAEQVGPRFIFMENVMEWLDWGPIGADGRPLKSGKGKLAHAFVEFLRAIGYKVEWRKVTCADHGDPTTRERLFLMAVKGRMGKKHLRCVFPNRTHAPKDEIESRAFDLFARHDRPLRPWVPAYDIIDWSIEGKWLHEMPAKDRNGGLPLCVNTLERIQIGLWREIELAQGKMVQPYIVAWDHQSGSGNWRSDRPLTSVTTKQRHGLLQPYLVELRGTDAGQVANSAKSIEGTLGAVTAGGTHHALLESYLVQTAHGNGSDKNGNRRRTRRLSEPHPAVCGNRGDFAKIDVTLRPMMLGQHGGATARPVTAPVPTVACAGIIRLVQPYLVKYYGTGGSSRACEPLDTVTTKDRFALVEPMGKPVKAKGKPTKDNNPTLAMPIVEIDGVQYEVWLRWRMLQPHELAAAQGFPSDYKFAGGKTKTTKQVGNAVPCNTACAIIAAALSQEADVGWIYDANEAATAAA